MNNKNTFLEKIKKYYTENHKGKITILDFKKPFSEVEKILNDINLIDDIFNNENGRKIIDIDKEKGLITCIDNRDFDEVLKRRISKNKYVANPFITETEYLFLGVKTESVLEILNRYTDETIKMALNHFEIGVIQSIKENEYINDSLNHIVRIIENLIDIKKNTDENYIKYYNFLINRMKKVLSSLMFEYYTVLTLKTKSSIKIHIPIILTLINQENKSISFKMNSHIKNMDLLREQLIKNKFIDSIDSQHFFLIFNNKKIETRINWISTKELLKYFIRELKNNKNIESDFLWIKTAHCFTIKGEEINSTILSRQKESKNNNKKQLIDELIKSIKK